MENRFFKIKGREGILSIEEYENITGLWFENDFVGIIVEETKSGFYYVDIFFKKQYVKWEQLEEITNQEN